MNFSQAFSSGNLGSTISGLSSGVAGVIQAGVNNAKIKDTSNIRNAINDFGNISYSTDDFDTLINDYFSVGRTGMTNWRDLVGDPGERALNTISGVAQGAMTGATFGPWGAVAGAAVGLGSGLLGIGLGNQKAKAEADMLNAENKAAEMNNLSRFNYSAGIINDKMFNGAAMNFRAYGGNLFDAARINKHFNDGKVKRKKISYVGNMFAYGGQTKLGGDWSNGVVVIGEGGSHETNPYDGVQYGVDETGTPNLVEEGEVIFNDYVYSRRLKPSDKQLDELKLSPDFSGKSFADIAKCISRESEERPNDPISKNGLIDGMLKLQSAQEEIREKKAVSKAKREFNKLSPEEKEQVVYDSMIGQQGEIPMNEPAGQPFDFGARYAMNGNPQEELQSQYPEEMAYGGPKKTPSFLRRMINTALINTDPAIATASGYSIDPDGNLKYEDNEGSKQLKKSLELLSRVAISNILAGGIGNYLDIPTPESTFMGNFFNTAPIMNKKSKEIIEQKETESNANNKQEESFAEGGNVFDDGGTTPSGIPIEELERAIAINKFIEENPSLKPYRSYIIEHYNGPVELFDGKKYNDEFNKILGEVNDLHANNKNTNAQDVIKIRDANIKYLNVDDDGKISFVPQGRRGGGIPVTSQTFNYYKDNAYDQGYLDWVNGYKFDKSPVWGALQDLYKYYTGNTLTVDRARELAQDKNFGPFHNIMGTLYKNLGTRESGQIDLGDKNFSATLTREPDKLAPGTKERYEASFVEPEDTKTRFGSSLLRYAPAIGSGLSLIGDLLGANNPDYSNADIIGQAARNIRNIGAPQLYNYLAYTPFDVNYEQNRIQNVGLGTQRNALNMSSGNRGNALASILSAGLITGQNMGNMYRNALEYNDKMKTDIATFNRGTDQYNATSILSALQANQKADIYRGELKTKEATMRDNIDTAISEARSKNLSNFYKNLGNLGNDIYYGDQAEWYINNNSRPYSGVYPIRKKGGKIRRKTKRLI